MVGGDIMVIEENETLKEEGNGEKLDPDGSIRISFFSLGRGYGGILAEM
jgi:hypothetical protein